MKVRISSLVFLFLLALSFQSRGQEKKIVQFTGIITDIESEHPVPYVSIVNLSYQHQFYTANHQGFFSFVAHEGDTIQLSSVGYRNAQVIIPKTTEDKYTALIKMTPDLISLPAVHLLPWASVEEFNIAFMNLNVASDDLLLAKENLSRQSLMEMSRTIPLSANEMQTFNSNQAHINLTNKNINQRGNNPLLNPFAWGQFINHIKRGNESRRKY
jgi:hypothetical protein